MKQIVDKLNKIAKKIDENVDIPNTDLITDSLDAITTALGGTPNDSNLIVDKLEDIAGVAHGGGGSSNEEYVILPSGEYTIDPDKPIPLIAGFPNDANYITIKIAGEDYIFEFKDVEYPSGTVLKGYYNSNFSNLIFISDGTLLYGYPAGPDTPETLVIDEIRAKPNEHHYFILTATLVNTGDSAIYVNDVLTSPEKILCLENGNIVDKTEEEIPAETSLVLNIIVGSDSSMLATQGGRQTFATTSNVSDLNNCVALPMGGTNLIRVIPDAFPINSTASVTITVALPK